MSDKPKTLHGQLMELAEWITTVGHSCSSRGETALAEGCWRKAAEVRALAERVKDCIIVKATVSQVLPNTWGAAVDATAVRLGTTKEGALARLRAHFEEDDAHAPTS